jgi:hypothetical protein
VLTNCRNCTFDAPLLVFKTRMMNIFFCRVTPLIVLFSSQEREYPEYLLYSSETSRQYGYYSHLRPVRKICICTVPTTKLRTPPSFYVYSYGATCLIATRITFERLGIEFFFFFWRPEEKSIYKSYTLDIFVGRTPKSLHPRLPIRNTLLPCHKRRVKTGFFKNR